MARTKWQERERALELIKLGYPLNKKQLPYLLDFLSDMNWPGAGEVLDYLLVLGEPIIEHVIEVLQGNDRYWQFNIIEYLLDNLPREMVLKTENQLILLAKIPIDKDPDDTDLAALTLLVKNNLWNKVEIIWILTTKAKLKSEYKALLEKVSL